MTNKGSKSPVKLHMDRPLQTYLDEINKHHDDIDRLYKIMDELLADVGEVNSPDNRHYNYDLPQDSDELAEFRKQTIPSKRRGRPGTQEYELFQSALGINMLRPCYRPGTKVYRMILESRVRLKRQNPDEHERIYGHYKIDPWRGAY